MRKKKHQHVKNLNKSESSATAVLSDTKKMASKLGLDRRNELRVLRETTDQKGITHSRLRQYYQGILIYGHHVVVASKNGVVRKSEER